MIFYLHKETKIIIYLTISFSPLCITQYTSFYHFCFNFCCRKICIKSAHKNIIDVHKKYMFQVFLSTNSPGGSGGVIRGGISSPGSRHRNASAPVMSSSKPIPASSYRSPVMSGYNQAYNQSPSVHGDDPWMRFM